MPEREASDRCSDFLEELTDLMRKHQVMIGEDLPEEDVFFEECRRDTESSWVLDIGDIEYTTRLALWDELKGPK